MEGGFGPSTRHFQMEKSKEMLSEVHWGQVLGEGGFGKVYRCINKNTGDVIAVKESKERYRKFGDCLQLKEVVGLMKLQQEAKLAFGAAGHPHVILLHEVVLENSGKLYMAFEFAERDLAKEIDDRRSAGRPFSEIHVNFISRQLFRALSFTHRWFFHRDIKPDNIMCSEGCTLIKLIDFGQARRARSKPPFTDYCGTRWYRAPELQIAGQSYHSPVDMWSAGCVVAEMLTLYPLLPGESEIDQVSRVCALLGSPTQESWPSGYGSVKRLLPRGVIAVGETTMVEGSTFESAIPQGSLEQREFIKSLLQWEPTRRPNAREALHHPCLSGVPDYHEGYPDAVPGGVPKSVANSAPSGTSDGSGHAGSKPMGMSVMATVLRAAGQFKHALDRSAARGTEAMRRPSVEVSSLGSIPRPTTGIDDLLESFLETFDSDGKPKRIESAQRNESTNSVTSADDLVEVLLRERSQDSAVVPQNPSGLRVGMSAAETSHLSAHLDTPFSPEERHTKSAPLPPSGAPKPRKPRKQARGTQGDDGLPTHAVEVVASPPRDPSLPGKPMRPIKYATMSGYPEKSQSAEDEPTTPTPENRRRPNTGGDDSFSLSMSRSEPSTPESWARGDSPSSSHLSPKRAFQSAVTGLSERDAAVQIALAELRKRAASLKAGLKAYERQFERLNGRRPLDADKAADGVADFYRRYQEVRLLVPKKSSTPTK